MIIGLTPDSLLYRLWEVAMTLPHWASWPRGSQHNLGSLTRWVPQQNVAVCAELAHVLLMRHACQVLPIFPRCASVCLFHSPVFQLLLSPFPFFLILKDHLSIPPFLIQGVEECFPIPVAQRWLSIDCSDCLLFVQYPWQLFRICSKTIEGCVFHLKLNLYWSSGSSWQWNRLY